MNVKIFARFINGTLLLTAVIAVLAPELGPWRSQWWPLQEHLRLMDGALRSLVPSPAPMRRTPYPLELRVLTQVSALTAGVLEFLKPL